MSERHPSRFRVRGQVLGVAGLFVLLAGCGGGSSNPAVPAAPLAPMTASSTDSYMPMFPATDSYDPQAASATDSTSTDTVATPAPTPTPVPTATPLTLWLSVKTPYATSSGTVTFDVGQPANSYGPTQNATLTATFLNASGQAVYSLTTGVSVPPGDVLTEEFFDPNCATDGVVSATGSLAP